MASLFRHHTLRLSIVQTISRTTPLPFLQTTNTNINTTTTTTTTIRRAYASKKAKAKAKTKGTTPAKHSGADETESPLLSASKKRAPIATTFLTPGSQRGLTDPRARDELARADAKMAAGVEWLRREVAQLEARASGRVTPQLLAPVRVSVPVPVSVAVAVASASAAAAAAAPGSKKAGLEELATVGVRDGSSLIVTVFDPRNLKHVQDALYEAKIQGVIPQRVDERTLKIPIPKPTVEARLAAYSNASKLAEEARVQIRRQHQASVKKGKYSRHSTEHHEFQKLQDRHIAEVDTVLARIKRSTGAR